MSSLCGNPSVALLLALFARLQAKSLHFLSKYFEVMCVQTYLHVSFEILMMYSQPGTKFQFVLSHHCFHGFVLTVTRVPNLFMDVFMDMCMCLPNVCGYVCLCIYTLERELKRGNCFPMTQLSIRALFPSKGNLIITFWYSL